MWPALEKLKKLYKGSIYGRNGWWDNMTLQQVTRVLKLQFAYHFFEFLCDTQDDVEFDEEQDYNDKSIFGLFDKVIEYQRSQRLNSDVEVDTRNISVEKFTYLKYTLSKPVTTTQMCELERTITEQFKDYINSSDFKYTHHEMLYTLPIPGHVPKLTTMAISTLVKRKQHDGHEEHIQNILDDHYDKMDEDKFLNPQEARTYILQYASENIFVD